MCQYYYFPQSFQQRTSPIKNQLDHANDLANQFHDVNVVLSHINVNRLEELNTRLAFLVSSNWLSSATFICHISKS